MDAARRAVGLLSLALLLISTPAWGETSPPPANAAPGQEKADWSVPAAPLPDPAPAAETQAPAPDSRLLRQAGFDVTWLPGGGDRGLQITDAALSATLAAPLTDGWAPLLLTPGAAAHFWDGPRPHGPGGAPDLPSDLYDLNLEIGWRPRLAEWLFADLAVTPGVYSDFKAVSSDAFQMRGRGLAIVALSPQLQFVAGGMYVNRNKTKFLPAGGVIWNPDDDTHLLMVFPQPKLAHRMTTMGDVQWWGYLSGEFGGGRWSVERADGSNDSLDYTDLRINLGVESVATQGLTGHAEVGYVFGRRVNFSSDTPDYQPQDTLMLRAGVRY